MKPPRFYLMIVVHTHPYYRTYNYRAFTLKRLYEQVDRFDKLYKVKFGFQIATSKPKRDMVWAELT